MIQRELQVVRLQYDFPGEWTFEGDFESNKEESPGTRPVTRVGIYDSI